MVKGLDSYILIGGTACALAMEAFGETFRVTKDLDIVLCIEALDPTFVEAFWDFVRRGRYSNLQNSTGKKLFYRFSKPQETAFPFMLELFSRLPDALAYITSGYLTPIPVDAELSSLSAILLDDQYYRFILEGKRIQDGLSLIAPEYIIPLKTKAWQDLTEKRSAGLPIAASDIKKHKNDVFRLFRIVAPENKPTLSQSMKENMHFFLDSVAATGIDGKLFGYGASSTETLLKAIKEYYGLDK
jgi:hypothetical protein